MKRTSQYLVFISVGILSLLMAGCKKEIRQETSNELLNKEIETISEVGKLLPKKLSDRVVAELSGRRNQPGYSLYLDTLKSATEKLINNLNKNNQLNEFKEQLVKINNNLNNSTLKSGLSIECQLKSLGLGYGIGADLSYISLIEAGLYNVVGYELQRGGGAKIVYDFVNLEREIFYFSVCYTEGNNILGGTLGAALSSGLGFRGFNEAILGFRCFKHGIDEYAGPSWHRDYSIVIDLDALFGISLTATAGKWNNVDAFCSWEQCLFDECPGYFSSPYKRIQGVTVYVEGGGSLGAALELTLAIEESNVGICSEKINGTYADYDRDTYGRLVAATLMASEMILSQQVVPAALSYFYGLFDPCICPNSPPNKPINPVPADGALEQDQFLTLSWNCSDPDGDPLNYDVYLGANGNLEYKGNTTNSFFTVNNLEGGTNYTWKINSKDDKNEITEGSLWHFRTSGEPNHAPTLPYNPNPVDGAINIGTSITLCWACIDQDNDPLRYHIYFGTEQNPGLLEGNVSQTTYPLINLQNDTKYYWKIIAEDDHNHFTTGTIWSFTTSHQSVGNPCPGVPTLNYGGQTYNTVQINDQCWLRENMNYQTGASWCYQNNLANCIQFGRLYDYSTAGTVCPTGWHLPSDEEWKQMELLLGISPLEIDLTGWRGTDQGTMLKQGGSSGFDALMGGTYNLGFFNDLNTSGYFWTSSSVTSTNAWARMLNVSNPKVSRYQSIKDNGFSVRCIKDN